MAESFWQDSDLPASENFDATPLAVGFAFIPSVDGTATHIRFRSHSTLSGGTYIGSLYQVTDDDPPAGSGDGTSLAQVTAGAFGAAEWVLIEIPGGVALTAGVLYKASLYSSVGRYLSKSGFFVGTGITRGNLLGVRDNEVSGGFQVRNGSFFYAAAAPNPPYPQDGVGGAYLVDIVFEPAGGAPSQGTVSASLNLAAALTGDRTSAGALGASLGLAPAITGSSPNSGTLGASLNLAPALTGARTSVGAVNAGLGLAPALAGARASLGSVHGALNLAPALSGARGASGTLAAALSLQLALIGSDGQAARPVHPFPVTPGPVSGFPWPPRPVKSFQEVIE